MQQTGSNSFFPASWICTATMENWKYLTCNKGYNRFFCPQVESVQLLWKTENIWHATNRFQQFFCLQVESVLLLWKIENIFDMQQTGSKSFFSCKLNLYCYYGKLKIFDMQQRFQQFFLPVSWICTAAVENWKYLTCNKQVPTVFSLQVESVLLLWKPENIWHATNRFQQFFPASWICTATMENWKYLTCNKGSNSFFACKLNLYCYCGKLKIYLTCNKQVPKVFFLQVESVLLLWKTENIWHATKVPTVFFACRLNLYCYCGKLKIYLTCNKQVPTVFFAPKLNLIRCPSAGPVRVEAAQHRRAGSHWVLQWLPGLKNNAGWKSHWIHKSFFGIDDFQLKFVQMA